NKWFKSQSKEPMPPGMQLVVYDRKRTVVKWGEDPVTRKGRVIQQRELAPGEKFPNLEVLNNNTPRKEWRPDFNGNLVGPCDAQNIIYFYDLNTIDKYSWPSSITVVGSVRCVQELRDKVTFMRKWRGAHLLPIVTLSDTFMPTRKGGRQRPQLVIDPKLW